MTELHVQLPAGFDTAIADRVMRRGYLDAGEYVRDLLRRDLATDAEQRLWLQAMIQQGIDSGVVEDKDAFEILQEIIDEDPDLCG